MDEDFWSQVDNDESEEYAELSMLEKEANDWNLKNIGGCYV